MDQPRFLVRAGVERRLDLLQCVKVSTAVVHRLQPE